jgi:uncharacterized repeat protein (TIGR03803 family)
LTTIYSSCASAGCPDGYYPEGGLVQATDGSFYGTTGEGSSVKGGYGTIFRIDARGALTTLYRFRPSPSTGCTDGTDPDGGLLQGTDGSFYGTTEAKDVPLSRR